MPSVTQLNAMPMRWAMMGFLSIVLLAGCITPRTWESVALNIVEDADGCEHLETITDTRSYLWTAEAFWQLPFVFVGAPAAHSEQDMREVRRRVDADMRAEILNEASEVEGANAVVLRTTKKNRCLDHDGGERIVLQPFSLNGPANQGCCQPVRPTGLAAGDNGSHTLLQRGCDCPPRAVANASG